MTTRCGYVALTGRSNTGKSTLLNRLVGEKVAITSRRPQTTRHSLLGMHTVDADQFVYVDTPGMHDSSGRALNRYMNRAARGALADVDVVAMLVEAPRWTREDDLVLKQVVAATAPCLLIINKIDRLKTKERLLPFIEACSKRASFEEIVPVSALSGDNVERLEGLFRSRLPRSPHLFPEDQLTDRSERFLVAEIVREQLMRRLGDELPHQLAVQIEQFEASEETVRIHATIFVERSSQRAIVIGKGGERLKRVGSHARSEIEALLARHVRIELWAKVRDRWSDDEAALQRLGYEG